MQTFPSSELSTDAFGDPAVGPRTSVFQRRFTVETPGDSNLVAVCRRGSASRASAPGGPAICIIACTV